ncbi:synembryn-A-like isoform X2 [Sinocyclocheilus anshuiensis]|uniref:synembryn-A-like isoform X2 n=1 Tax=Sinocyclocheilus anshuiensis TaxID=1608454 RepID=UPI0007B7A67E|nr:PREDICTED: synembryn-A-like isoform X2 [Sinocyclocheilus anshuiensis]
MPVDVEKIIQFIKQGDQDNVQIHLDDYNTEILTVSMTTELGTHNVSFLMWKKKREKKQRELEEFRRNKVREYVPDSDSDFDSDENEDQELVLRRRLAAALIWFIRMRLQPGVLRVCLRTLRIISRDRKALAPLITDYAILTLARLGGISALPTWPEEEEAEWGSSHSDITPENETLTHLDNNGSDAQHSTCYREGDDSVCVFAACAESLVSEGVQINPVNVTSNCNVGRETNERKDGVCGLLTRRKRDARGEKDEEEEHDDGEVWRKEAMKALCNVIYNSPKAQERACILRLLHGLSERLKDGIHSTSPPSGQFYELRLLFLLTALRPELRIELCQERGVSMLTAALEQCLEVCWGETHEVLTDLTAPPVSKEVTQRALEILKTLFNITYSVHRQEVDEEAVDLYRHLAAVLRHCLLVPCEGEDRKDELQGHTVNVLSALPLQCLDVLLSVRLSEGSKESGGVNMDCVHTLLLFMEKRLDRGHKLKEKLAPVLNLLTDSSKAHRETRHCLRQQILPPLRDVEMRPEQGNTLRGKLVRLMTHVDTDIKHCAAELLFVLCKENVSRFVKYTGYGNAAGLLAARGLLNSRGPSPQPQYSSDSDSDTEEYRQAKDRINPVTGRVEVEQPDPMEGMTEEEKEAEALRLINMFNKLSRGKIIQPMGVTTDGKLAPLCGQTRHSAVEEEDEEEEEDSETEQ